MLNQKGIHKVTAGNVNQILFAVEPQVSVGIVIANTGVDADSDGKKIIKAGTPVTGSLVARNSAFAKASDTSGTKGTWTLQITTAFATDETITIDGTTYTCGASESADNRVFAGANANAQAASLKNIIVDARFDVTVSTDTLTFTQKVADSTGTGPVVSKTSTTGAIGSVTAGTSPVDGTNNAVGVLLHDVDVTAGNANATMLIFGFVNLDRLDAATQALITNAVKIALNAKVTFLK